MSCFQYFQKTGSPSHNFPVVVFILDRIIGPLTCFFIPGVENDLHVGPSGAKENLVACNVPNLDGPIQCTPHLKKTAYPYRFRKGKEASLLIVSRLLSLVETASREASRPIKFYFTYFFLHLKRNNVEMKAFRK